jgi:subtilisin family serine protease
MGPTAGQPAITIPAVMIALADGNTIEAQLGSGVSATLAAATAADTIASFSSRGPRLGSPTVLKPDIAAPGVNIVSLQTGVTCASGGCITASGTGYLAGSQALTLSGTSMASPHIAGTMALLRQLHSELIQPLR